MKIRKITCISKYDGHTYNVCLDWMHNGKMYSAVENLDNIWNEVIKYKDVHPDDASEWKGNWRLVLYKRNGRLYWAYHYNGDTQLFLTDINNDKCFYASPNKCMGVMLRKKAENFL